MSAWLQVGRAVSESDLGTESSPLDAAVFGILIAASLLVLSNRQGQVKKLLRQNLPILLFFLYCAASIVWSDYPFVSLKRWVKAVGDFTMVLVVLTDRNPPAAIKRFFTWAGFLLLPLSVLFIKYYPDLGRDYNRWTLMPTYTGVTQFKNLLGMTCLVCGLGSLWAFLSAREDAAMPHRVRHLIAHGPIVILAIFLLVLADSMTSLSCLLMAGTVMVLTTRSWVTRRKSAVHIIVGGFVALSLVALFFDAGGQWCSPWVEIQL